MYVVVLRSITLLALVVFLKKAPPLLFNFLLHASSFQSHGPQVLYLVHARFDQAGLLDRFPLGKTAV